MKARADHLLRKIRLLPGRGQKCGKATCDRVTDAVLCTAYEADFGAPSTGVCGARYFTHLFSEAQRVYVRLSSAIESSARQACRQPLETNCSTHSRTSAGKRSSRVPNMCRLLSALAFIGLAKCLSTHTF